MHRSARVATVLVLAGAVAAVPAAFSAQATTPTSAPAAAAAADPSGPVWDAASGRWWMRERTTTGWRATAWWDGTRWVPVQPPAAPTTPPSTSQSPSTSTSTAPNAPSTPSSAPSRGERRNAPFTDSAGTSSTFHLLGQPARMSGIVVYLDGDGMSGHDAAASGRGEQGPLDGTDGIVEAAVRRGFVVLSIRTPSSDGTFWRDMDRNADYVDELTRHVSEQLGTNQVALVGYSGGANLITRGLLVRHAGLCTVTAVVAGGGGAQSVPPAPSRGTCPVLWATGTNDVAAAANDGYDAISDARAGAAAYSARGWPAMIWTPVGVDHAGIRRQLGRLLDYQLGQVRPNGQTPSPTSTTPSTSPSSTSTTSSSPPSNNSPSTTPTSTATTTSPPQTRGGSQTTMSGQTLRGTLTSKFWPGRSPEWIVATPQGPVRGIVIVLHGKTDTAAKAYDELDLAAKAKATGFALAAIDGDSTYWTGYDGVDTGAMVLQEYLPLLAEQGLPVDRVGLTGYSMGGLGALLLAEQLGPQRVFGVAPMSAAVWEDGKPGAEGQAQQRVRSDVGKLAGIPVRIASGTDDDLTDANRSLAGLIPHAQTEWVAGGHDFNYWTRALDRQLAWLAQQQSS